MIEDTKSGSYCSTSHVTVARRQACNHTSATGNLRLTHFQCSQYTWSGNQGNVTSNHAADSVTFARKFQVQTWSMIHMILDLCSQRQYVLHLHQEVCQNIDGTNCTHIQISHSSKSFLPTTQITICLSVRKPRCFVARRTVTDLSFSFASVQHVLFCRNSPLCLLQNFL